MRNEFTTLGPNPVKLLLRPFLRLSLIGLVMLVALAVVQLAFGGTAIVILSMLFGTLWIYLLVNMGEDLILAYSNLSMYRASSRLVQEGHINPQWFLRDAGCNGLIAVDEQRQLVLLSGTVVPFASIMGTRQRMDTIEVSLRRASNPVVAVSLDDVVAAETGILQLNAALQADTILVTE